ncbi:MAG: hypothetical protein IH591_08995, partial [Bacteroidales bacterium]|nr:hypothetical protein [Bacteroidales bacterium]
MVYNRNIRSSQAAAAIQNAGTGEAAETQSDSYYNRLMKLIPAEAVAFYLALDGIASNMADRNIILWVVFFVSVAGTWLY